MYKNIVKGIVCLMSIAVFSQDKGTAIYLKGNENFKKGKYKKAIKNYTQLIEKIDVDLVKKTGYINRGLSRDKLKEYDLAILDFTEAIKLDSIDMASFVDRGLSKMHAGYLDQAKEDYKYVIDKNSNSKMMEASIYWTARINYSQGKYQEVIKNCDEYFKVNSTDPELYFIRGTANDILGNFEQSIIDYTNAIEFYPNYFQAYANRGTAKINLLTGNGNIQPSKEETKSACEDLKKARDLGDTSIEDLIYIYCKKK
ncbi:hypothetical protein J8L88_06965 [Aquimarina sp. MMG015]|uniref:tetratricopeptide repeat protein n=1 Tax=unclassified Aquimarina TaxID=2627091 RepID=UPI000E5535AA|nr:MULTISPECIES: hypothetical protein [unclassified Aquimarina]AXT56587.1 hypothetical protein D1815_12745 [Aquimarina sp. AD1]MBQ4802594.1 hypothetical protein [Aquimarina sp. MMG015]RKN33809.1 hypothetical protein D7035_04995 [Aquimarina sp. AD1]